MLTNFSPDVAPADRPSPDVHARLPQVLRRPPGPPSEVPQRPPLLESKHVQLLAAPPLGKLGQVLPQGGALQQAVGQGEVGVFQQLVQGLQAGGRPGACNEGKKNNSFF